MSQRKNSDIKDKIADDADFILCPKFGNSIKKLIETYNDGIDNAKIAKVLLMTEKEVEETYQSAINKIRQYLNIKLKD
jgi:hypothetical protein